MGSIACERPKGLTDQEFFTIEYPWMDVLATARVGGVIYAAAKKQAEHCGEDDNADEVFALVMPYSYSGGRFQWKEQDETVGPYDTRCPERILDLLTETDNTYANEWRAACRANAS